MHRAIRSDLHGSAGESAKLQLLDVRCPDIEVGFAPRTDGSRQLLPVAELLFEPLNDFRSDFIASLTSDGAECRDRVAGVYPKASHQVCDGSLGDAGCCSAPAGMNGRYCTRARIPDEYRETIGGLYGEQRAINTAKHGVTLWLSPLGIGAAVRFNLKPVRGMGLAHGLDKPPFGSDGHQKAAPILVNI